MACMRSMASHPWLRRIGSWKCSDPTSIRPAERSRRVEKFLDEPCGELGRARRTLRHERFAEVVSVSADQNRQARVRHRVRKLDRVLGLHDVAIAEQNQSWCT